MATKKPDWACGPVVFLQDAIYRHGMRFRGRLPRQIMIHPAVWADLLIKMDFIRRAEYQSKGTISGVRLVILSSSDRPSLVNAMGDIEFI